MFSDWNMSSPMTSISGVCLLVSVVLIVAAIIDGYKLKVPNWITFPLIITGWIGSAVLFGWAGLGWSLAGTAVGLALLLPAYAIGGMGAGDVKLLAGVGGLGMGYGHLLRLLPFGGHRRRDRVGNGDLSTEIQTSPGAILGDPNRAFCGS